MQFKKKKKMIKRKLILSPLKNRKHESLKGTINNQQPWEESELEEDKIVQDEEQAVSYPKMAHKDIL